MRKGLPAFSVIGLPGAAVREARERVHAAILNSGFEFPARRVTANLAPADMPKGGPGLDLALACAILAATGQLPRERLDSHALLGELALDGRLAAAQGTVAVAHAARAAGLQTLVLAGPAAAEARLVEGIEVAAVDGLASAVRVLRGGRPDRVAAAAPSDGHAPPPRAPDLADVLGQHDAVRALVIAAAGGHNLLLTGPPGTGKTMLAWRAAGLLPPLSAEEALEVTRIASLAGQRPRGLAGARPFRAPHHGATAAALVGAARDRSLGEVVLAHNGVLFLDELSEFRRSALEALRQPLEEGRIALSLAGHRATYPARFVLLAATNPCPCGYAGEQARCTCTGAALARHARHLSGPLLDRIDMLARLRLDALDAAPLTTSARARERVVEARERQLRRLREEPVAVNAHMDVGMLRRHAQLDAGCEQLLRRAAAEGLLSMRGRHRAQRVARTIADLAGRERVGVADVRAALALRPETIVRGRPR